VRVPLWIVRVPAFIIDNHGGIWSDNNMALIAAIFRLHRPLSGTAEAPGNKVVTESAKPYVLPTNPQLKR
jgi:exosome complex RNA-binding protein Rrp42 (RNase PH superfamily)